jgi:hypothetical protein
MNGPDQPIAHNARPDAEKDALIVGLKQELQSERALRRRLEHQLLELESRASVGATTSALLARLRDAEPETRAGTRSASRAKIRLGGAFDLLRSRGAIGVFAAATFLLGLDYGIGHYQQFKLEQKRLSQLRLEHAAYTNLFAEVVGIAHEPDHRSYRLKMVLQNLDPQHAVYVMLNPIRVYEQVGLVWKEVPARAPGAHAARIVKLADKHLFETIFEPNLKDWTELMPGYMHVRFDNDMLISQRSEPDDDIVARKDPYYVYLKPLDADDEAIRKRMKYPGEPPIYIPMPPH